MLNALTSTYQVEHLRLASAEEFTDYDDERDAVQERQKAMIDQQKLKSYLQSKNIDVNSIEKQNKAIIDQKK